MILGTINRGGSLPALLRPPPAMIQRHLDMKPFLSFPVEPQPALGLFPRFSTMDPIHKPMMSPNFGVPLIKTKRPVISCNVCQIRFNSESQAEAHYKGNRHARRVKGIENAKTRQKEGAQDGDRNTLLISPVPSVSESDTDLKDHQGIDSTDLCSSEIPETMITHQTVVPAISGFLESTSEEMGEAKPLSFSDPASSGTSTSTTEGDDDKAKKLLYCALCKVSVNSLSQLEAHNKGTKHKTILEARSGLGPIKAYPRLGGLNSGSTGTVDSNTQERTFHCEICNVRVSSEGQLKQHISSRRHRDGVSGKPNPLLSRHKKQQTLQELTASLVFSKDLSKNLSAGLLPSPLAVAMAAAAVSSPLNLRPGATPPLLQAPHLTHHMLRPAPGPIRTAHGTILFSPY
ncbi:PREDICTED: zinc finger protein 385A isoform X1 [Nanorana parkeri]|uniref:zinc finger protein 385A isoform X1 n=1 Tax=Nanorana parkeri TaxID=125878 RepID=UPI000854B7FE|nr:PREDICTED: zinc finger protein 385A isoform X1 [Nanorana parkeri]